MLFPYKQGELLSSCFNKLDKRTNNMCCNVLPNDVRLVESYSVVLTLKIHNVNSSRLILDYSMTLLHILWSCSFWASYKECCARNMGSQIEDQPCWSSYQHFHRWVDSKGNVSLVFIFIIMDLDLYCYEKYMIVFFMFKDMITFFHTSFPGHQSQIVWTLL